MRAYSIDLRQKVVEAYDRGVGSQRQIAESFGVSRSFVEKLLQRRRTTGDITPLPQGGGGKPALDAEALTLVRQLLKDLPPDGGSRLFELYRQVDAPPRVRDEPSSHCEIA